MIRLGNKIRLTVEEQVELAGFIGHPCNPRTVEEYNAYLEQAKEGMDSADPEDRLFCALMDRMRI